LLGKPVDMEMAAGLPMRLNNVVKWAKENPSAVPNAQFVSELEAAIGRANSVQAFIPVNINQLSITR
jgi:hypothetical protein